MSAPYHAGSHAPGTSGRDHAIITLSERAAQPDPKQHWRWSSIIDDAEGDLHHFCSWGDHATAGGSLG